MSGLAAILGGGVIGGGWAARFLLMGWDVRVFDPDPEARSRVDEVIGLARASLPGLIDGPMPDEGVLSFQDTIPDAVSGADWVQESVPERLDLKRKVYQLAQAGMRGDAILGSSTSGFRPSQLQGCASRPGQIVVTHPFNPVYLLPLVELVTTEANGPDVAARATAILSGIGCHPLHLRNEIDAHVADRLLEAVWREALWLVADGTATTQEIDDAIRLGFGLRWAQMGVFETYRIAGGAAGMRHFMAHFGPALKWPWTRLTDVPDLTDALIDRITAQSDAQSGGHAIRELERIRDANLVTILRGLKARDWGAGRILNEHDGRLPGPPRRIADVADLSRPIRVVDRAVPLDWTDFNGHMNEARYLTVLGNASDRVMELIGVDADYIAAGQSFFSAETHIRHMGEALAGQRITVESQCLMAEGKKLHLFHRMYEGGRLIATGEHMLIHVDLDTRRACPPGDAVARRMAEVAAAHAELPVPDGAGAAVGRR